MSALGRAYRFLDSMPLRRAVRLPADVADELLAAACYLSLASSNMRAEVSTKVTCTDATPVGAGSVEAVVSRDLACALFDHTEHRGRYTRMD